jgi:hypothetical protein
MEALDNGPFQGPWFRIGTMSLNGVELGRLQFGDRDKE